MGFRVWGLGFNDGELIHGDFSNGVLLGLNGGAGVTVEAHGSTVVRHDLEDDGGNSALVCPFFCCGKQHPSDAPPESGKKEKTRAEIVGNSGGCPQHREKERGGEGWMEGRRKEGKGTRCACVRSSAAYL